MTIAVVWLVCYCSTPYQPKGMLGGYRSYQLEDNDYKVIFKGNQHTSAQTVHDYLLRRCAEITIEKECEYFIVYEDSSYVVNKSIDTGPELDEKINAYQSRSNNYLINDDSKVTADPKANLKDQKTSIQRTFQYLNIDNKSTNVVGVFKIHMFKERIEGPEDYYFSASEILKKYKRD
jgi:hypothetical protein